jgi:hypothetical protein
MLFEDGLEVLSRVQRDDSRGSRVKPVMVLVRPISHNKKT